MAGLGAEIIKVELAPHGDGSREFDYVRDQRSAFFIQLNRGKKSLYVDFAPSLSHFLTVKVSLLFDILYSPATIDSELRFTAKFGQPSVQHYPRTSTGASSP
jgi:hypothetical protein